MDMPRKSIDHLNHSFSTRPFGMLIRQVAPRVSKSAAAALRDIIENIGLDIARRATDLAKHAGRVTVQDDDVRMAFSHWRVK